MTRARPPADRSTPRLTRSTDGDRATPTMLLVVGPGSVARHPLARADLVIGRGDDVDVQIDHPALSRRHLRLRVGPPTTVQDLGSTNGTRINGRAVKGGEPIGLRGTDSFHVGPFTFVLVVAAEVDRRSGSLNDLPVVIDPTPDGVSSLVRTLATSTANVIVLGETGVGKEVLASTLHALSQRQGPLICINCAALSESLLESELFGHERGAFTGAAAAKAGLLEAADRGTVFLDEVGELPLAIQAKLLRAIEQREVQRLGATRPVAVDVRFVAATNRNLVAEVEAGRFRRDLFFRLDGMTLTIPPLRERRDQIAPLALTFVAEAARRGARALRLTTDALAALEAHPWPGNVRELRAVIDRATMLCTGTELGVRHLRFTSSPDAGAPPSHTPLAATDLTPEQQRERAAIIETLAACAGNQTRAARQLGWPRTTLASKLAAYRIPRPRG